MASPRPGGLSLGESVSLRSAVLAHPLKTRLIADAQIKTDKIDAAALATLLRGNLVACAHVPGKATRLRKVFRVLIGYAG